MQALFFMLMGLVQLVALGVTIYGVYLCFKKHWALGLVGILVPGFPLVVGAAKLFKKELLA